MTRSPNTKTAQRGRHMTLTIQQRAILRRRGVLVLIERGDGVAKCLTASGVRYYETSDLARIAQPSIGERLIGFFGRAA